MSTTTEPADLQALALLDPVVEVKGEITTTNFPEIREMIRAGLESLNLSPETDEEFGQAEKDAKSIKAVESALSEAKDRALAQAAEVQALFSEIDETSEELRRSRLDLEKAVKAQKEKVRKDILEGALSDIDCDDPGHYRSRVASAMKGKRTLASLKEAANQDAACINRMLAESRTVIDAAVTKHGSAIAHDRTALERMPAETARIELERRVERIEAEKERARLKAEAEAERKKAREQAEKDKKDAPQAEPPAAVPSAPPRESTSETPSEELARYCRAVATAMGPLKAVREALKHPENREAALKFAGAINDAYTELRNRH